MSRRAIIYAATLLALTGAYFAAGKLGLLLAFDHANASPVWPPAGLAVAAVLLLGWRIWPAILFGSFLVNLTTQGTVATSLAIAGGNTLEALLGAWIATRFAGGRRAFDHAEDIIRFVLYAAVPATALSATIGVTSLTLAGFAEWSNYQSIWITWWTGNLVSMVTAAPLVLTWSGKSIVRQEWHSRLEAVLLLAAVLFISILMFGGGFDEPFDNYPIGNLAILPLLWAAMRFYQPGAITCAVAMCSVAVWGTLNGHGPFTVEDPNASLMLLQAFIGVASLTALILAAVVADRVAVEQRLREQEQHMTMALSSGGMGTWQWDIASGRVKWSPRLEEIHGMQPGEFLGTFQAFLDDVHPDDVAHVKDTIGQTLTTLSDHEIQYRLRRKDGEVRWVEGRGRFVVDPSGKPVRLVGVCMDVTDRKLAEVEREELLSSEREARRQAEYASIAKDEFLAVLSHELRTPLTPVMLTASLLERSPELPEKLRADMKTIRQNVELEARLIDDLLDLTKVTHGKLELDLQVTDAHELIRRAFEICCPERDRRITKDLRAPRSSVKADPARLQQVFWNLLSNAVKFTPPEKPITIHTREEDDHLIVEFIDHGPGIEPELLPRLFRAFEQGQAARRGRLGGLGLGLAISRALVSAHGGTLEVHSDGPGTGATFTVKLPLALEPADRRRRERPPGSDGRPASSRRLRILLVEDHESTLLVLRKLLRAHGHDVTTAASNQEALAATEAAAGCGEGQGTAWPSAEAVAPFDLVISDLGLPDGLAYDLMSSLRQRWDVPGIALSGYGTVADVARTRESGFAEHLTKPVDLETLLEAIERVTSAKEDRSPASALAEAPLHL